MKEIMLILATMMPEERLIAELEESLTNYKLIGDKKSRHKLAANCQMFILRVMTNGSGDKMQEVLKEMRSQEERENFFKVNPS